MFRERLQEQKPFSFRYVPEGLHLMKQPSRFPGIEHYGVLVAGKFLREFGISGFEPVVIQQTYPGIKIDRAEMTGTWSYLGQVHPALTSQAIVRIREAFRNPSYNLLTNNCEQVARYVTEGKSYSTQVRSAVLLLATFILANGSSD